MDFLFVSKTSYELKDCALVFWSFRLPILQTRYPVSIFSCLDYDYNQNNQQQQNQSSKNCTGYDDLRGCWNKVNDKIENTLEGSILEYKTFHIKAGPQVIYL